MSTCASLPDRRPSATELSSLAAVAERPDAVRKADLHPGDWLVVSTKNSAYVIGRALDGAFTVSGGWFETSGRTPVRIDVHGCTFGGHAIHSELLAAPGLFLEFGNRVKTTRIREVRLYRGDATTIC